MNRLAGLFISDRLFDPAIVSAVDSREPGPHHVFALLFISSGTPLWLMSHDTILWYSLWVSNDVRVL